MGPERQRAGREGEALAARHLAALGYEILARNYRSRLGEVDLIARQGRALVFVEVKSWATGRFGAPEEWIPPAKRRRLGRVASLWLGQDGREWEEVTLGAVIIDRRVSPPQVRFIADAVELEEGR